MRAKKYLLSALVVAGATCATQSFAQTAAANNGWIVGVGAGISKNQDYDCDGCGPIATLNDDGTGYKVFGGYQFGSYFAAVAGFAQLADTTASGPLPFNDRLEVSGPFATAVGILPFGQNFYTFASLGVFRWSQDVTYNGSSGNFTGTDLTYSAGAGYRFPLSNGRSVLLHSEIQIFKDVGSNDYLLGHIDDYSLTTLNLAYRF